MTVLMLPPFQFKITVELVPSVPTTGPAVPIDMAMPIRSVPAQRRIAAAPLASRPPEEWYREGEAAVRRAAASGHPFQAYDLVRHYDLEDPAHPGALGGLMSKMSKAGVVVPAGRARSARPGTATQEKRVTLWRDPDFFRVML